ncbi:hypothetical protein [Tenacibaculum agarivorans]|uniref:hypothetical protein n=1 Tax=Tenacibaculum agarivorans TaxID=1908389 RepID=UPI00094B84DE|nr:hypothetical protein [Tenacibaculum agarivorans]
MKTIKKINKYLIEHYPLIWNTRLVWMLAFALVLHLGFFIAGFVSIKNHKDISVHYSLEQFYYDTPAVFVGTLISIISLLIWLIFYLQNNAFKNFYKLRSGSLFLQFCILFIIFFSNVTHYFSYTSGITTKIKSLYTWENIDADIKKFNNAALFLLENKSNYTIKNKEYPDPFPLEMESTSSERFLPRKIDTSKSYFRYEGKYYQFYKINHELIQQDIKQERLESIVTEVPEEMEEEAYEEGYYDITDFKYRIVYDVSNFKKLTRPNLRNFSKELYNYGQDSVDTQNRLKYYKTLLDKKDTDLLKNELESFLSLAKKYTLKNNLNTRDWLHLINVGNDYEFITDIKSREVVRDYKKEEFKQDYFRWKTTIDTVSLANKTHPKDKIFFSKFPRTSDGKFALVKRQKKEFFSEIPFLQLGNLDYFFKNVYTTFHPSFNYAALYFLISVSLVLAILIFLFKTTGIKNILLSAVAAGVILILLLLLIFISERYFKFATSKEIGLLISIITGATVILLSIVSLVRKWKKIITSILFSLALFTIPLTTTLTIFFYRNSLRHLERNSNSFLIWFEDYGFWFITSVAIISVFIYAKQIRNWKSWPQ